MALICILQVQYPGLMIITISSLLIMIIPLAAPLSFNLTSFTPDNDRFMSYEVSYPANNVIYLTGNGARSNMGRATYALPLHLWDRASGQMADFTTHFAFVINSRNSTEYGDGLAFFLAPNGSRIPQSTAAGGTFGLTTESDAFNSANNPFIAVEFDIYSNPWDPLWAEQNSGDLLLEHVGIDVSSVRSLTNSTWFSSASIRQGLKHEAWIRYDSQSMNLSVEFTGFANGNWFTQSLSYIVDLRDHLPEFVTLGFSAATGDRSAQHNIHSWSFSSNLESSDSGTVSGTSIPAPPAVTPDSREINPSFQPGRNRINHGLLIGLTVVGSMFILMFGLLMYCFWKNRTGMSYRVDRNFSIGYEFERGSGPKRFAYNDLKQATNNFALQDKLGEGGFGTVYKGFLKEMEIHIAVKKVSRGSKQGIKEYASEVNIISKLRHRNLVQLLGWCHEKKELLLVYEFMPNGSLDSHLFRGQSCVVFGVRFKIAQGLASALLYLHEECKQYVLHRDIKSSNIMLDANFDAKLGDFGLARLVDHEKGSKTTVPAGTYGYMAPECMDMGKASKQADVFSFGVVVLEIATGRKPTFFMPDEGEVNLVEWAWRLYGEGKLCDAADPQLGTDFNPQEMERLMGVGLWCAHPDSNLRPSIRQAVLVLNFEAHLPVLSI